MISSILSLTDQRSYFYWEVQLRKQRKETRPGICVCISVHFFILSLGGPKRVLVSKAEGPRYLMRELEKERVLEGECKSCLSQL